MHYARPVSFRFIRCLPSTTGSSSNDNACGQALDKPRGRKPRSSPMQPAFSLWRLINVADLGCGPAAGDASVRSGVEAAIKTISHVTVSSDHGCRTVYDAQGTTVRSSAALTQSRRLRWRSKQSAHRWAAYGGARIGTVRGRMSMTSMGAPQCRQMKVGRSTMTVSCGVGRSSGVTPSSVRIFLRFARRTGLESNP